MLTIPKCSLHLTLLAGALGLAATAASAQGTGPYGPDAYSSAPTENLQVITPRFHPDTSNRRLNGPLEKVSLSGAVRYDDLNLRTRRGARALRWRVVNEAQRVCANLAEAYPFYEMSGTSCYKTAAENALLRADAAIRDARDYRPNTY